MKMREFLWCDESAIDGVEGWYYCGSENAIVNVDLRRKAVKSIRPLITEGQVQSRLYRKILKRGSVLYVFPDKARDVIRYDTLSGTAESIPLRIEGTDRFNILSAFWAGEDIYMISDGLAAVIRLNTAGNEITCLEQISNAIKGELLVFESVLVHEHIYIPMREKPVILSFDIRTEQLNIYHLDGIEGGFFTICHEQGNFWLTGNCKKIISWNPDDGINKIYDRYPENFSIYDMLYTNHKFRWLHYPDEYQGNIAPFYQSVLMGRFIWLIPRCGNAILYIDSEQSKIGSFLIEGEDESDDTLAYEEERIKYIIQYIYGKTIGLYSTKNKCVYEIETEALSYHRVDFSLDDKAVVYFYDSRQIFMEKKPGPKPSWDLQMFIQMLNCESERENRESENTGRLIHDFIQKEIGTS